MFHIGGKEETEGCMREIRMNMNGGNLNIIWPEDIDRLTIDTIYFRSRGKDTAHLSKADYVLFTQGGYSLNVREPALIRVYGRDRNGEEVRGSCFVKQPYKIEYKLTDQRRGLFGLLKSICSIEKLSLTDQRRGLFGSSAGFRLNLIVPNQIQDRLKDNFLEYSFDGSTYEYLPISEDYDRIEGSKDEFRLRVNPREKIKVSDKEVDLTDILEIASLNA